MTVLTIGAGARDRGNGASTGIPADGWAAHLGFSRSRASQMVSRRDVARQRFPSSGSSGVWSIFRVLSMILHRPGSSRSALAESRPVSGWRPVFWVECPVHNKLNPWTGMAGSTLVGFAIPILTAAMTSTEPTGWLRDAGHQVFAALRFAIHNGKSVGRQNRIPRARYRLSPR